MLAPMLQRPLFQPEVPVTRETYREGVARIRASHHAGDSGLETARQLAHLSDTCLRWAFDRALTESSAPSDSVAIVPVGGYGRRQLNPCSDLDILIVHRPGHSEAEEVVMKLFFHQLWDMGLKLGHSARTPDDCARAVGEDPVTTTALLEHRLLCGSAELFADFRNRFFTALSGDRLSDFVEAKLLELDRRFARYASSINVAQPDLKLSPGGVRDFHFALWISLARYRTQGLEGLAERGVLYRGRIPDYERALDFILRMRHELHFCAGRGVDTLTYDWQEPVAKGLGYSDEGTVLAEERMMRNYYRAAHHLFSLAQVVANHCRYGAREPEPVPCADRRMPAGTVVQGREVKMPDRYWDIQASPMRLFDFIEFMHDHPDLILSGVSEYRASEAVGGVDPTFRLRPNVGARFLALLLPDSGAGRSLRMMQEIGFLERLLPAWKRVRNLVRKDLYHAFSVDEHLLLAVELLEHIPENESAEERRLLHLWRQLERKDLLRLAVLLHDVGKGSGRDHSQEGAFISEQFCRNLGLPTEDTALVRWLIEEHLLMGQLIRSADVGSHEVLVSFARRVKTRGRLDHLHLLTYVDIKAVGPGMMNAWKLLQLDRLYRGAVEILEQGLDRIASRQETRGRKIATLTERLPAHVGEEDLLRHLDQLPKDYALYTPATLVDRHMRAVEKFDPDRTVVEFHGDGCDHPLEIIVITRDRLGLFYLLCSACLSENLSIHDARLDALGDEHVLDTLYCFARPAGTCMEAGRLELVEEKISRYLAREELPPVQKPASAAPRGRRGIRSKFRSGVRLKNDVSPDYTVLEIRTLDRMGILQAIAGTLVQFRYSIHFARINTEGMRAVDVFYITDEQNKRIEKPSKLKALKAALDEVLS